MDNFHQLHQIFFPELGYGVNGRKKDNVGSCFYESLHGLLIDNRFVYTRTVHFAGNDQTVEVLPGLNDRMANRFIRYTSAWIARQANKVESQLIGLGKCCSVSLPSRTDFFFLIHGLSGIVHWLQISADRASGQLSQCPDRLLVGGINT
ncbi:hypothetical protein D3C76_1197820 [compost metagenome]